MYFFDAGYLSLGYSTPFLSLGSSYMYSSLAAAKAAVISVGEEIASQGLPLGICPLVFVFTGTGNGNFLWSWGCFIQFIYNFLDLAVSLGAQEIFELLPHTFVEPSKLPELFVKVSVAFIFYSFFKGYKFLVYEMCIYEQDKGVGQNGKSTKRVHHVYGCIITSQDMVEHQDPSKPFDKVTLYQQLSSMAVTFCHTTINSIHSFFFRLTIMYTRNTTIQFSMKRSPLIHQFLVRSWSIRCLIIHEFTYKKNII